MGARGWLAVLLHCAIALAPSSASAQADDSVFVLQERTVYQVLVQARRGPWDHGINLQGIAPPDPGLRGQTVLTAGYPAWYLEGQVRTTVDSCPVTTLWDGAGKAFEGTPPPFATSGEGAEAYVEWFKDLKRRTGTPFLLVLHRPVFNEDYTQAIVRLQVLCGLRCGNRMRIFTLERRPAGWALINEVAIVE